MHGAIGRWGTGLLTDSPWRNQLGETAGWAATLRCHLPYCHLPYCPTDQANGNKANGNVRKVPLRLFDTGHAPL